MPDAPGATIPRFPSAQEGAVARAVGQALERWRIGPGDLCLCGGARGGDLLFAEACLRANAHVLLLLALPMDEFIERSVRIPGTAWETRFRAVANKSIILAVDQQAICASTEKNPFARCNDCLITLSVALAAPREPLVLLVWDRKPSKPGKPGTGDFAEKAVTASSSIVTIDPLNPK